MILFKDVMFYHPNLSTCKHECLHPLFSYYVYELYLIRKSKEQFYFTEMKLHLICADGSNHNLIVVFSKALVIRLKFMQEIVERNFWSSIFLEAHSTIFCSLRFDWYNQINSSMVSIHTYTFVILIKSVNKCCRSSIPSTNGSS